MTLEADCVIAFVGGAAYEIACVYWAHFSERGRAIPTAFAAMFCAASQVAGIGESVHNFTAAPFFVVGYGVGAWIAVMHKR